MGQWPRNQRTVISNLCICLLKGVYPLGLGTLAEAMTLSVIISSGFQAIKVTCGKEVVAVIFSM